MTMKPTLIASLFVVTVAAAASAGQAPVVPAVPAVPPAPVAPPPPPPQLFIEPLHFPEVHWNLDHINFEEITTHALAQAEKAITYVGGGKGEPFQFQAFGQIQNQYSQARNFIERNQYDRALEPLDKIITAKGERADAAMYWKAYSLMKLGRRDEALSTLGQLQKLHPDSRWLGEARSLEVEVKQAAGQPVGADGADDEVKLLALQGILRTDPEAAFPVVEKMLAGGSSVRVKERALFVLSQNRNDRARTIIAIVARGGSNPDLQLTAIRYLGTANTPDAVASLIAVYKADSSIDVRKAVITSLVSSQRTAGAIAGLVALARAERNAELKTLIVRHLSSSSAPEARQYMLELLK
jgi:tetratricopeptide (TPR) repeat protein